MASTVDVFPVVRPARPPSGPPQGQWTHADYAALPDDGQRYEIVDGVLYMTPSPVTAHQRASHWLVFHLTRAVDLAGIGEVFAAPYDVELAPKVVLQPDIVVVLNQNAGIVTEEHIVGVPDLVVEILSPGTAGFDRRDKQDAYAAAELGEYWIADPTARTIEVLRLSGDGYESLGAFHGAATLPSAVIPDLASPVEHLFTRPARRAGLRPRQQEGPRAR